MKRGLLLAALITFARPLPAQDADFFSLNHYQRQLLSDEEDKRAQALKDLPTLSRKEKNELVGILEFNIENPDRTVRLRTLIALEKINNKSAKKVLEKYRTAHTPAGLKIKNHLFEGTDPVIKRQQNEFNCYEYENIFVMTLPSKEEGEIIAIKRKPEKGSLDCRAAFESYHFHIDNPWEEYFFGAYYPYVFIKNTSITGADWLTLYDVRLEKKMTSIEYYEPIRIRERKLEYWEKSEQPAARENCETFEAYSKEGIDMVIKRLVLLRLKDFEVTKTDKTRCVPRL